MTTTPRLRSRAVRSSIVFLIALVLSTAGIAKPTAPVTRGAPVGPDESVADTMPRRAQAAPEVTAASDVRRSIEQAEYFATDAGAGLQAPNRTNGLRTYFDASGARVVEREDDASALARLRAVAVGRGASLLLDSGEVSSSGGHVDIRRRGHEPVDRASRSRAIRGRRLRGCARRHAAARTAWPRRAAVP
jgi:hypothetical protein